MKRPALAIFLVFGAAFLAGCPVYDHMNEGCFVDRDCAPGYVCASDGQCISLGYQQKFCNSPSDCLTSQTCTSQGTCADGDCTFHGSQCVTGYVCAQQQGAWSCVPSGSAGAGGSSGNAGTSGAGTGGTAEAGAAGG